MSAQKSLTIPNIIQAMQEAGFTTKGDLDMLREEIKQDNLETLAQFQAGEVDPKFEELRSDNRKIHQNLEELKVGQKHLREDIKLAKWDKPTRKEFNDLKQKVDSLAKN